MKPAFIITFLFFSLQLFAQVQKDHSRIILYTGPTLNRLVLVDKSELGLHDFSYESRFKMGLASYIRVDFKLWRGLYYSPEVGLAAFIADATLIDHEPGITTTNVLKEQKIYLSFLPLGAIYRFQLNENISIVAEARIGVISVVNGEIYGRRTINNEEWYNYQDSNRPLKETGGSITLSSGLEFKLHAHTISLMPRYTMIEANRRPLLPAQGGSWLVPYRPQMLSLLVGLGL